jgi:hypothetical protein
MEGGRRHGKLQPRPKNREVSAEDCGKNLGIVSVRGFRDAKFVSGVRIRVSLQRYRKHVESTTPLGAGRYQRVPAFERMAAIRFAVVATSIP